MVSACSSRGCGRRLTIATVEDKRKEGVHWICEWGRRICRWYEDGVGREKDLDYELGDAVWCAPYICKAPVMTLTNSKNCQRLAALPQGTRELVSPDFREVRASVGLHYSRVNLQGWDQPFPVCPTIAVTSLVEMAEETTNFQGAR